jgi:hypothetical protein
LLFLQKGKKNPQGLRRPGLEHCETFLVWVGTGRTRKRNIMGGEGLGKLISLWEISSIKTEKKGQRGRDQT